MIERLRRPSPGMLMLGILLCGAIAVSAFVISILSLREKIDTSQRDSLCRFYASQITLAPPPSTPRGIAALQQARAEYRALGCKPAR